MADILFRELNLCEFPWKLNFLFFTLRASAARPIWFVFFAENTYILFCTFYFILNTENVFLNLINIFFLLELCSQFLNAAWTHTNKYMQIRSPSFSNRLDLHRIDGWLFAFRLPHVKCEVTFAVRIRRCQMCLVSDFEYCRTAALPSILCNIKTFTSFAICALYRSITWFNKLKILISSNKTVSIIIKNVRIRWVQSVLVEKIKISSGNMKIVEKIECLIVPCSKLCEKKKRWLPF